LDARLVGPGDAGWAETLQIVRHDVYHLPSFAAFATAYQDAGEPQAFVAADGADRMLVPLIVRPVPAELLTDGEALFDAVSPRGFPGPVVGSVGGAPEPPFVDRAVDALVEILQAAGIVSVFMRLHPLLEPPLATLARVGEVLDLGDTVSIDLSLSEEEMWSQTRHMHRRSINKAHRAGYTVRMDEAWDRLDDFAEAYAQSMARLGATGFWRFSADYFRALHDALGDRMSLCVVEHEGRLAGGAILTEEDGIAEYHAAGTMDAHVAASPSKLIIDFARRWAKSRGDRVLHLAGSTRKGDSLIDFKLGFSPRLHQMHFWRLVAAPAAYARLTERAGSALADASEADFFPAYRLPSSGRPGS
jgi:hypothetical protein